MISRYVSDFPIEANRSSGRKHLEKVQKIGRKPGAKRIQKIQLANVQQTASFMVENSVTLTCRDGLAYVVGSSAGPTQIIRYTVLDLNCLSRDVFLVLRISLKVCLGFMETFQVLLKGPRLNPTKLNHRKSVPHHRCPVYTEGE